VRAFDTGANRLEDGKIDDLLVRTFADFAIVTGRTQARGEYAGQAYDVTLRFTDVFVRRSGQWQAVASQATRIANSDSASQKA
jgi:ketosteroid isomerase-like protein